MRTITPDQIDFTGLINPQLRHQTKLGPCLLVSRETGAGGSEIAARLAERFSWDLFDKQIIDELAIRYGTSPEFLNAVDEKHVNWLTDIFYGWLEGNGFSQLAYVHRLHLLFNRLARRGNAVIVGRGGRFVLPRQSAFSVRIIASFDYRVRQLSSKHAISFEAAQHQIEEGDRARKSFLKKYFHQDATDPHLHDMVVNVEQLGPESAYALIEKGLECWLDRFDSPKSNQHFSSTNSVAIRHSDRLHLQDETGRPAREFSHARP
jgi:cytidylate kinase